MATPTLNVLIAEPERGLLFQGTAQALSFPGEQGVFEVLPLHRPLVSRLLSGVVSVDGRVFSIVRGIVRVADDIVTAVVELP